MGDEDGSGGHGRLGAGAGAAGQLQAQHRGARLGGDGRSGGASQAQTSSQARPHHACGAQCSHKHPRCARAPARHTCHPLLVQGRSTVVVLTLPHSSLPMQQACRLAPTPGWVGWVPHPLGCLLHHPWLGARAAALDFCVQPVLMGPAPAAPQAHKQGAHWRWPMSNPSSHAPQKALPRSGSDRGPRCRPGPILHLG